MLWTPSGPTVAATAGATLFVPAGTSNMGGVARVFNNDVATQTFTLGPSNVTNTKLIPLRAGESMYICYANTENYIFASATTMLITPGIGNK